MSANGSNILAVVGGAALTLGMVGVHLVQAVAPHSQAQVITHHPAHQQVIVAPTQQPAVQNSPTAVPQQPTARPAAKATSTGRISHIDNPTTHTVPPTTVPATATVIAQVPAQSTVVHGDQTTFTSQTPPFRISYPVDWDASSTSNAYNIVSPDSNAGVGVYLETGPAMNLTMLQAAVVSKLPEFLQQYGGIATSTPQFQTAAVDGIPAVVSAFPVAKNGLAGYASVSAVSYHGVVYYVWGLVADSTADGAEEELAQLTSTMNSFQLF